MELLLLEAQLAHLPIWSSDADCPIHWYLQVSDLSHQSLLKFNDVDWKIKMSDETITAVQHASSGSLSVFSDEPSILDATAKMSQAQLVVMMLQPYVVSRAEEMKKIVHSSASMPRLLVAWLRANILSIRYRQGSTAVARYGADESKSKGENRQHIVKSLMDIDNSRNSLFGLFSSMGMGESYSSDDLDSEEEDL